jgi:hypothetical protein
MYWQRSSLARISILPHKYYGTMLSPLLIKLSQDLKPLRSYQSIYDSQAFAKQVIQLSLSGINAIRMQNLGLLKFK